MWKIETIPITLPQSRTISRSCLVYTYWKVNELPVSADAWCAICACCTSHLQRRIYLTSQDPRYSYVKYVFMYLWNVDDIMHFTDCCRFLIKSAFKFTALCTILPHCVQYYRTVYNLTAPVYNLTALGPWRVGGMGPETSHVLNHGSRLACLFGAHVHKITNGRVIYTAL